MTSLRRALIPAFLILTSPLAASAHDEPTGLPHLRPLDRRLIALVEIGMRESPSFRALVERLDASDVVVYVRCSRKLRPGLSGQLTFVGATAGIRYVLVALEPDALPGRIVAMLGHELMHAVEIAATPAIVDSRTLGVEYERMGRSARGAMGMVYDTTAAVEVGMQVWREVFRASATAE